MKKILTMILAAALLFTGAISAKTATQIKNEEKAKAYKAKKAQEKAAKTAKTEKKAATKAKKKK